MYSINSFHSLKTTKIEDMSGGYGLQLTEYNERF